MNACTNRPRHASALGARLALSLCLGAALLPWQTALAGHPALTETAETTGAVAPSASVPYGAAPADTRASQAAGEAPPSAAAPAAPAAQPAPAAPAASPRPSAQPHPNPAPQPNPNPQPQAQPNPQPTPRPAPAPPSGEGRMYSPGAFEGVEIGGAADVRYAQGDVDQVYIEGSPEMQRTVSLDVRDGLLRIRSEGNWKFWNTRRLQVQITSRTLGKVAILGAADFHAVNGVQSSRLLVHISGAGLARFDQLRAEQLVFSVSGAGDAQVTGQVRDLTVNVSGKGEFRGENLQSQRARLSISGIGDVKVWAVDDLTVNVAGIGQVEYWGTPRVRQSTSGPSSITARGGKVAAP